MCIQVGGSAEDTSQFIEISTKAYRENNIGCTLKHFPGYASNLNTHNGSSVDNREQSQFYGNDLKPFQAGIDAGAPVVMVNHNIVSCFDAENPASISPEVHSVLRKDLHFSGLICTDSLDMGATKNITDGTIVESGTPEELMQKQNGLFRHMTELQKQSSVWEVGK